MNNAHYLGSKLREGKSSKFQFYLSAKKKKKKKKKSPRLNYNSVYNLKFKPRDDYNGY